MSATGSAGPLPTRPIDSRGGVKCRRSGFFGTLARVLVHVDRDWGASGKWACCPKPKEISELERREATMMIGAFEK